MKLKKKAFYRLSAMLFLSILIVVFLANLLIPDKKISSAENRVLQTLPSFSLSEYFSGRLETKLENYANDQFVGRNKLIKVKTAADVTEGVLISNGVIRCKDHYLMEKLTAPEEESFKATKDALKQFKAKYDNIDMFFLLAPNAASILSSKLPSTVKVIDQNQYMDDFFTFINQNDIEPVDVRKAIKDASKTEQVYYYTDHHWTTEGARAAFSASSKKLGFTDNIQYKSYVVKNNFRGTLYSTSAFTNGRDDSITICLPTNDNKYKNSIYYYSDTKKKTTEYYEKKYLEKKDAYAVFGGSNHPYFTIDTPTDSEDVLLLLKDSYANCMIPFLAQKYRRIIVIDPRYYFDNLDTVIESEEVTKVLFLYNANTFFEDTTLRMALTQ